MRPQRKRSKDTVVRLSDRGFESETMKGNERVGIPIYFLLSSSNFTDISLYNFNITSNRSFLPTKSPYWVNDLDIHLHPLNYSDTHLVTHVGMQERKGLYLDMTQEYVFGIWMHVCKGKISTVA